ncbi:hypothetical protein C8J56DRAFT_1051607 [Mycena floridula]|nr:hypothetical protein C8J56DRAFT_1051607 [Mycena floridula]
MGTTEFSRISRISFRWTILNTSVVLSHGLFIDKPSILIDKSCRIDTSSAPKWSSVVEKDSLSRMQGWKTEAFGRGRLSSRYCSCYALAHVLHLSLDPHPLSPSRKVRIIISSTLTKAPGLFGSFGCIAGWLKGSRAGEHGESHRRKKWSFRSITTRTLCDSILIASQSPSLRDIITYAKAFPQRPRLPWQLTSDYVLGVIARGCGVH